MMLLSTLLLLVACSLPVHQAIIYECTFEEECEDFEFDSYWIVAPNSSHADHTFKNISGHYTSYTNTSESQPLTTIRTRSWIFEQSNQTMCVSFWIYSGPGGVVFQIELAQGDDHQARLPNGMFGINIDDPQWRGVSVALTHLERFATYILFTNISSLVDIDDISIDFCNITEPPPPPVNVFNCDFDQTPCLDLSAWPNYMYNWSRIQAKDAQNYTSEAPGVDFSVGEKTGHYYWLNNSQSLQPGGLGYFSTRVFSFPSTSTMYCLSFQYYGFGATIQNSRLIVMALTEGEEKYVQQIWPIDQSNYTYATNRWSWAFTSLPIGNYSVLFGMNSNKETGGSFALDSISIESCPYPQRFFYATSRLQFACDFDSPTQPWCDIQNDATSLEPQSVSNFTIRYPRNIANRELGPRQGSGWSGDSFLYWTNTEDASVMKTSGGVRTPLIEVNGDMCIQFAYFVNTTNAVPDGKNIEIHLLAEGSDSGAILLSIEVDSSFGWQPVTQPSYRLTDTTSFRLVVTQQQPRPAVVAFDDIVIAQCASLHVLTTTTEPPTTPRNKSSSNYVDSFIVVLILLKLICFH